jgi:hypothetical protein
LPLIQWTTIRLVVSENDGRPSRQRNKTHRAEETYLRFAPGDETRLLGLRKTARSNSGGLNAETRMGGIEPMGKISLLTFLFIGLPDRPETEQGLLETTKTCRITPHKLLS